MQQRILLYCGCVLIKVWLYTAQHRRAHAPKIHFQEGQIKGELVWTFYDSQNQSKYGRFLCLGLAINCLQ